MPELNELHRYARAIFDHVLSSVDPRKAVKQAITVNGPIVDTGEARLDESEHCVLLSSGTDGIDGNSPAAGAIADETTLERARSHGLDAHQYLARSEFLQFLPAAPRCDRHRTNGHKCT